MQSEILTGEIGGDSVAKTRLQCSRNRVPIHISINGFDDSDGPLFHRKSLRLHGYGSEFAAEPSVGVTTDAKDVGAVMAASASTQKSTSFAHVAELIKQSKAAEKDPELQLRKLEAKRAALAASYWPLWQSLALTPEQIARFAENVVKQESTNSDIVAAAQVNGLNYNDPVIVTFLKQARDDYEAAQRELLGAAGYGQWQDYLSLIHI